MITHFIHPWNMDSFLSLQPQCLKTTFFKREVTLKVSEIYGEVLLLHFSIFHVKQSLLMLLVVVFFIITFIVLFIIIMLCFQRHKLHSICIWFNLHLLKKCSKTLRNWSKREHIKLFAMGPVLM